MCYVERIEKVKEFMIEEIIDSCEGENFIEFDTPLEIGNGYEFITQIYSTGKVIAVDEDGNEGEGNIDTYPVEALAHILDGVEKKEYLVFEF